jgi:4-amino-4-deoxy-L-arabinose transferase-like glycosyltransferase
VFFVAKGIMLAIIIGPFTGHDEVDHFFYIQRLAQGEGLGHFGSVMLPKEAAPYEAYVADFPYNAEVIQPPLYHLLLAPVYALLPGDIFAKLFVLRMVSLLLGAAVVLLSFALAAELFPNEFAVRAGTPIFVALQPQFSFEAAIVNHDILVILLATLLIWLTVTWSATGLTRRQLLWLGAISGLGIVTKTSFGLMLPVLAIAILLAERRRGISLRRSLRFVLLPLGVALLIALPWFVRSLWLYGDPTGAKELRSIPGFAEQAQGVQAMLRSPVFWRSRLEDFWGNYGWRLIPFDPGTYRAIYATWAIAVVGWIALATRVTVALVRGRRTQLLTARQRDGLTVVAVWSAAMIAGVIYVGTIQFTQSRFAFPAMAAFGMLTSVGYAQLLPARQRWLVPPLMFGVLFALNVVTAIRFLIPFYAGHGGAPGVIR